MHGVCKASLELSPVSLSYLGSEMHSTPPKPLTYCCVWMHAAAQCPFPLFSTESQVGNGPTVGKSCLNKYDQKNLSQTCQQGHFSVNLVSVKLTVNTNHHKGVMELMLRLPFWLCWRISCWCWVSGSEEGAQALLLFELLPWRFSSFYHSLMCSCGDCSSYLSGLMFCREGYYICEFVPRILKEYLSNWQLVWLLIATWHGEWNPTALQRWAFRIFMWEFVLYQVKIVYWWTTSIYGIKKCPFCYKFRDKVA